MKNVIGILSLVLMATAIRAQVFTVSSPNGIVTIQVDNADGLYYSVKINNTEIINPSSIALHTSKFDGSFFKQKPTVINNSTRRNISPSWGVTSVIEDNFNELTLTFSANVSVQFRAYDKGVAWRYLSSYNDELIVKNEVAEFNLPVSSTVYFPATKGFLTPFEPNYQPFNVTAIQQKSLGLTPFMFTTDDGKTIVISESNLFEYPGMFVEKSSSNGFRAVFPKYPKRESQEFLGRYHLVKWPQLSRMVVRSTEDYIAKSKGTREFPWRVIMIANSETDILNNHLVYQLANEPQMDFSWVKPGKVVWDWYYNWNIPNVDFIPGINTQTYKHNIDFAARHGIEYVNIDDGWSKLWDFNNRNPNLNVEEVVKYAKSKNVGIFIWAMWNTIDKDFLANLDRFQQMGVAGLKVDFFDRTDQRMVDFVNRLAYECAKRKLLLNLHGMYKPTGINRTYANVVNVEGVLGLEYNKFSDRCTPTHNLTLPFVRNVVGPMDYTPGAMRYMPQAEFKKSWDNPHAMTTRAHQLAMYIVYHGGVQMFADSPTFYEGDSVAMAFLSQVPVSWDETIPISGKIGEFIAIARRKGDKWFIGAMAGNSSQSVSFNLNFLDERDYNVTLITDGESANTVIMNEKTISKKETISIDIKATGGFVMILK